MKLTLHACSKCFNSKASIHLLTWNTQQYHSRGFYWMKNPQESNRHKQQRQHTEGEKLYTVLYTLKTEDYLTPHVCSKCFNSKTSTHMHTWNTQQFIQRKMFFSHNCSRNMYPNINLTNDKFRLKK